MIKLSDYVFKYLEEVGVRHAFTLTGGGIMHLVDSLGRSNIEYVCCHHEQAASIAAQAYDMYREQLSVCLVTTGPGGTNALTGCAAAFVDSTPVIYMTGQVKRADFASLRHVRQFGAQENDIVSMAKPVVKYAVTIMDAKDIAYELEKAVHFATTGRKGPVWIDIPLDVQAEMIDEKALRHFMPEKKGKENFEKAAEKLIEMIKRAERPILYVGQGMKAAKSEDKVRDFVKKLGIPVMATWRALDFMATDDENFFGSPGLQAPRYSNLIMQSCDLLIVLGSRLDNMITAFNEEHFAHDAEKLIVDIDEAEIDKLAMTKVTKVVGDVGEFMESVLEKIADENAIPSFAQWKNACRQIKIEYPILNEKQDKEEGVSLYAVTTEVGKQMKAEDVVIVSSTSRCNTAGHIACERKEGQISISSMGMGSMGFAIPSAVGGYYAMKDAGKNGKVIVFEGDGSLQLNIQELETIKAYNIPAKMFIFNNKGYAAITTMQDRNFDGFYVGSNEKSRLYMPDMRKIAEAYEIPYGRVENEADIEQVVKKAMDAEGAYIVDVVGSLWFDEIPKCISKVDEKTGKRISAYLENPYPFMEEEKLKEVLGKLRG